MELLNKITILKNVFITRKLAGEKYNFKNKDVINMDAIKDKGRTMLVFSLADGRTVIYPLNKYKLNKQGSLIIGTSIVLTTGIIAGSIATFKYSNKDGELKLSDGVIGTNIEDIFLDEEEFKEEISLAEAINENPASISIEEGPNYIASESQDEIANVGNYRVLSVEGDQTRGLDAYNVIMDNYYDAIMSFGIMYGVDPAMIASLMMEEGGAIYNPTAEEDETAIGYGQINADIWDGYVLHPYNFVKGEYEEYKIDKNKLKNKPINQIQAIAIMLQEEAIRYNGNFSAMTVCYNQGMGTVDQISNKLIDMDNGINSKEQIYSNEDPLLIYRNDDYTYGNKEYTNRLVTFLDLILKNKAFGRDFATIKLPSGEEINYVTEVTNNLSRS